MSGDFTPKYTRAQKDALIWNRVDRGTAAPRIRKMAAEGLLKGADGDRLEAFAVPVQTIYKLAEAEKKRRMGKAASELTTLPPEDGMEIVRRRLLAMVERRMKHEEKRTDGQLDVNAIREMARTAREIAHLTAPGNQRAAKPGARVDGQQTENQTRGTLADRIAKAAQDAERQTAPTPPTHNEDNGEQQGTEEGAPYGAITENGAMDGDTERLDTTTHDAPGLLASALAARGQQLAPT